MNKTVLECNGVAAGYVKGLNILQGVDLVPIIFQEISIGLICGMILSICFGTVILAGEKIGRLI